MHQSLIVIVRGANLQATNFREALEGDIPEVGDVQESGQKRVDDGSLENVTQRDPVQEAQERFESRFYQSWLVGGVEDFGAELENGREFLGHGGLEVPCLDRGHLVLREIEDFLGQQAQDCHVVLTDREAGMAGGDNLVDKGGPVVRPLLFQDRDQDQVQFVQECAFGTELLFGAGVLDDEIDDEVPDTCG